MKDALHDWVDTVDERMLRMMYAMMQADQDQAAPLPEAHQRILDERLAEYERNPQAGSSWQEVRASVEAKL